MKVQIVNMTEIQLRIQFFSIFRSDGIWFMRNTIFPEKITYHQYVSNKITYHQYVSNKITNKITYHQYVSNKITYHQYVSNKITNERCKLSTPNDEYQRKSLTISMYLIKLLIKGAS
jgi:hypothetical protein